MFNLLVAAISFEIVVCFVLMIVFVRDVDRKIRDLNTSMRNFEAEIAACDANVSRSNHNISECQRVIGEFNKIREIREESKSVRYNELFDN
jgi:sensor histidine kinase YesM